MVLTVTPTQADQIFSLLNTTPVARNSGPDSLEVRMGREEVELPLIRLAISMSPVMRQAIWTVTQPWGKVTLFLPNIILVVPSSGQNWLVLYRLMWLQLLQ